MTMATEQTKKRGITEHHLFMSECPACGGELKDLWGSCELSYAIWCEDCGFEASATFSVFDFEITNNGRSREELDKEVAEDAAFLATLETCSIAIGDKPHTGYVILPGLCLIQYEDHFTVTHIASGLAAGSGCWSRPAVLVPLVREYLSGFDWTIEDPDELVKQVGLKEAVAGLHIADDKEVGPCEA